MDLHKVTHYMVMFLDLLLTTLQVVFMELAVSVTLLIQLHLLLLIQQQFLDQLHGLTLTLILIIQHLLLMMSGEL